MSPVSPLLQEQLDLEKRSLEVQMAVLKKGTFVAGAMKALADEINGDEGTAWRDLKAELKIGNSL